jgi:hypothetical protein
MDASVDVYIEKDIVQQHLNFVHQQQLAPAHPCAEAIKVVQR